MDLVTLIVSLAADRPSWRAGLYPEHTAILRMCRRPLSVAEISSYLRLPYSATAILIADLLTAGLVVDRKPVKVTWHDPDLLREVIHGLQRL